MKRNRQIFPVILSLCLFCSCAAHGAESEADITETAAALPESTAEATETVTVTEPPGETEKRIPVSFAKTESYQKDKSLTAVTTVKSIPLAENQLEYIGENFRLLFEFNGTEALEYYPHKADNYHSYYLDNYCVLHTAVTVTNTGDEDFDYAPWSFAIYGRYGNDDGAMSPNKLSGTGLAAANKYYTVAPGENVELEIDFVGGKICIENAEKISYEFRESGAPEEADSALIKNPSALNFEWENRKTIRSAVACAAKYREEQVAEITPLEPEEGEYSVLTRKNSYCFSIRPVADGRYIRVDMRLQCLTGKPEFFDPWCFGIFSEDDDSHAYWWNLDPIFVIDIPETVPHISGKGVTTPVYDEPSAIGVRPDGSAEYTMYFPIGYDRSPGEYYIFRYKGYKKYYDDDNFELLFEL